MFNYLLFYSPHQFTALHKAAYEGHVHVVMYLVEQGVDINIKGGIINVSEQKYTADCKLVLLVRVCVNKGHYY